MPLIELWKRAPEAVQSMTAAQIVANAGTGDLKDDSDACMEIRGYLSYVDLNFLAKYANDCLETGFNNSGFFLQDIVNELGRRLDYEVKNGLYRGRKGRIGYDGLWTSEENHNIIVETKTTDAYRIRLDSISAYKDSLVESGEINKNSSILVVVGREDTGDFEAQIRGSRYAWDVRMISIDALIRLAKVKEASADEDTTTKIRNLLIPVEYTKLDGIIDVIFTTAVDIEDSTSMDVEVEALASEIDEDNNIHKHDKTEPELIRKLRSQIIRAVSENIKQPITSKSRVLYRSQDGAYSLACPVSKRYQRGPNYWYAYRNNWRPFFEKSENPFVVFGCVDKDFAFMVPQRVIEDNIQYLSTTNRSDRSQYWHIQIQEGDHGEFYFLLTNKKISLNEYMLKC
jgi:hypothetical protein